MSNSVEPQAVDVNSLPAGELKSLEAGFKLLWESARRAAESLTRLREEKRGLQETVERMERELDQLRREAAQLKRQVAEQSPGDGVKLAGRDRDVLATRVKELIAKLDAYL